MHKQIENLSIEQMREIVEGAPERAEVCIPCLEDVMYFAKRDDGKWFKWSNGYNQWLEYFGKVDPMDLAMDLNDLRTAIAKHDSQEFKVGDWVLTTDPWFGKALLRITGFAMVAEKTAFFECGGFFRVSALRHATSLEIKAGHRLEAERHG
ncbi:hypothetical protein [Acinetobacter guillouiae]|uniref:Uncharacterized protein n=1 Tax=Acinetobacter guillouiae NIPH 991 TaxID=1217656 RepID=N8YHK4_ACIGI|nr:hypothetical protein [Acinetobacter guillouiae]ENV18760.1 hypothetical protein F964_00560 [Acinetobacter guillouiae NIPH 991]